MYGGKEMSNIPIWWFYYKYPLCELNEWIVMNLWNHSLMTIPSSFASETAWTGETMTPFNSVPERAIPSMLDVLKSSLFKEVWRNSARMNEQSLIIWSLILQSLRLASSNLHSFHSQFFIEDPDRFERRALVLSNRTSSIAQHERSRPMQLQCLNSTLLKQELERSPLDKSQWSNTQSMSVTWEKSCWLKLTFSNLHPLNSVSNRSSFTSSSC